ncbi:MAG: hypothetical protein ACLFV7_06095 [Phycisphaerae bacterium]
MKNCTRIVIHSDVLGRLPRHFGVNVEIQQHAGRSNLWDWLAHSNATAAREFHPDRPLRKPLTSQEYFAHIRSREDFDLWRKALLGDPDGKVRWHEYLFDSEVPWIGVPDEIARKLGEIGVEPLYALGYGTKDYPRPLIKADPYPDAEIDWAAAASAYEYYFAVMYHFAGQFGGRYFLMMNEPENQAGGPATLTAETLTGARAQVTLKG